MTFGANKEHSQVCDTVSVGVRLKDSQAMQVKLYTVPLTCEPLASQPIDFCVEAYDHLSDLNLADSSDVQSRLEVGLDQTNTGS